MTAASPRLELADIEAERRRLKHTIQECQKRLDDLDTRRDLLTQQLMAKDAANSGSLQKQQQSSRLLAQNGSNGNMHAGNGQNDMQGPPGFSLSPEMQQRLGNQQAAGNSSAPSFQTTPQPPLAQPHSAEPNGAHSNGKPATPQNGSVFARLGVPTTRPTPQGPESRSRTSSTAASPSTAPQLDLDHFPPGFAATHLGKAQHSATADPRQADRGQGRADAQDALPSSKGIMYSDRMQSPHASRPFNPSSASPAAYPQPASRPYTSSSASPAAYHPPDQDATDSASTSSAAAHEGSEDLPPGFATSFSASLQNTGLAGRGNGSAPPAMPTPSSGSGASAGSSQPQGNGAPGKDGLSSQGAWAQADLNWAEEAAAEDGAQQEFPDLAFGIRDLDQRKSMISADIHQQDFPSLGGPGGPDAGPKPAGAWGRGTGSLRAQQQGQVAASLMAASQQPQRSSSPAVHVEHQELSAGLRVQGDDVADSVRRKRAKRHEFEKWECVRNLGNVNIAEGLELYENVLSPDEQSNMIAIVEDWVVQGKQGRLRGRTFSAPRKWAKGKGRITCQFGCCYNYAIDSAGRQPGIVAEEVVEKMPPVLLSLCKRLVRWGILPKSREPDTAIVNVYDSQDCIPPHIDHHDFDRPFCTISLLSEQSIMFGQRIISRGPGDFDCDYSIPLPKGSCLVLKGNGADVAQHCVPPVSSRRISITLRRMQDVHARRVLAMAERVHAGLPVDVNNPPSGPQRISADDAYDLDERQQGQYRSGRRYR